MLLGAPLTDLFHSILALALGMARIFPCLLLTPVFNFSVVKGVMRAAIVVALSLFIAPTIKVEIDALEPDMLLLAGLVMKELVIGCLIGLLLAMPFWLFESVGGLFDNQRGALMGGQINPQLGPDVTPLGKLMQQSIILLLIIGLGLSTITQIIWDSYHLWRATEWMPFPSEAGFQVYLRLLGKTFTDMVLYAGPLVAIMLLMDFAIGIMSIYSPQLQATALTIPVKCLLGMLFFILYLPLLNHLAGERLYELKDLIHILPHLVEAKGVTP
ncbi:type III secretion system export apparatus subunit SctT [Siccibacter colletis]|uniref:Type III secretion system export apparatus subunit SctT n=1 Tax=Siccibacter colletis TaxID=1505757 RepID=A0ABY6JJ69_9ENTR|nr:type III secretion system export apparatus subunit SctT [Siccibacter colletis]UYU33692.1 type III secretion system export apparatus subunit SctT [Siccibacter colletis]